MNDFLTSLRLFLLSIVVCSVAYPAVMGGFAALTAPESRQGSLVRNSEGEIVGSRLLAQNFSRPEYFWPRPSACDYNAGGAAGSNWSPTNSKITVRAEEIIGRLQPGVGQPVPADLVSASGSGLDPHVTLAAAMLQASRVAAARNLLIDELKTLVREHSDSATLAVFGDPVVNVLELNLALEELEH